MATALRQLDLPYRPCVGIMLIDRRGLVWVGRRRPKWAGDRSAYIWQMPQGGISAGEDALTAALRELEEETGIRSVAVLAESPGWYTYDLPEKLRPKAWGGRFRGQRQRWFAMRFHGRDGEVALERPGHPAEFDAWRWAGIEELVGLVVPFKRAVYEQVVREFALLARPQGGP